ncbi:MAG: NADH-quinone oxidoreductase subunit C [Desulfurococcales archaeon]|nr:NADH-quinone oxidoreductase subunit C [Desulfurococcales archaeon]
MSLDAVRSRAEEALRGVYTGVEEGKGFVAFRVPAERVVEAAEALKSAGFDHVKSVTAVDRPKEGVIEVTYHVSSYSDPELARGIVGITVSLPRDNPRMPSLSRIWVSAEFQEREVFEFFGVVFEGHPDLRPILLIPPLAEKHPLRKDFIVKEEQVYKGGITKLEQPP